MNHRAFGMTEKRRGKLYGLFSGIVCTLVIVSIALGSASRLYPMELELQVSVSNEAEKVTRVKANFRLGEMLLKGVGCDTDYAKARLLLERAGEQVHDLKVQAWS